MHVLLVGAELEENLALRYLAAALQKAGHTAAFATFDNKKDSGSVLAAAARERPDLIGMSMTFQFRAREFGELAGDLRQSGFTGHITCGGHFPTFAHREVLEAFHGIDSVVRHEGETTLVELCRALSDGRGLGGILGVTFRGPDGEIAVNDARPLAENLDDIAFPVRFGPAQEHLGIPAAFLVGSRGCFGHCTFCCIHAYLKSAGGPKYRMRSAANIADEMARLRRERGARMFVFHDDDFFVRDHEKDLARVTALRDELAARGVDDIALVVKARPDDVDDRVFDVLEQIGLLRVYLGIEAGSTRGLKVLGRGVDIQTNRRALDTLRARDVYTCFNMLAFDPESTLESLEETFAFLRDYATVPMNFCRTEIYVGTPLMTKLSREQRLIGDVFGWDYRIRDPRAERAFRIFASAFLDRNFRCDGLMNATLGLGYQLHLLRRFYPKAMTSALRDLADETTRRVNLDCVDRMTEILAFAGSRRAEDDAALEDFIGETSRAVEAKNRELEAAVADATMAIVRAATAPPARPARSRWGALSAASLALIPLAACGEKALPMPPDPLPMPTLSAGPPTSQPTEQVPPPMDPLPPPQVVPSATASASASTSATAAPTTKPVPTPTPRYPPPPDPLPPPVRR